MKIMKNKVLNEFVKRRPHILISHLKAGFMYRTIAQQHLKFHWKKFYIFFFQIINSSIQSISHYAIKANFLIPKLIS